MERQRVQITIEMDLDSVPGTFHTSGDALYQIERILHGAIPHYNPHATTVIFVV